MRMPVLLPVDLPVFSSLEMYCEGPTKMVGTYGGRWQDGTNAQGGYADYIRVQGRFAVEIPKELDSEAAAPLMCAGK